MNTDELSVKSFGAGYPYTKSGVIVRSGLGKTVSRYAKNYKLGKKKYSLCIISTERNTKKIEKWLDEQAKKITAKDLTDGFKMLGVNYE